MVHLARVALSGRPQDVMALLHRFAKGYRDNAPTMATCTRLSVAASRPHAPRRCGEQTEAVLPSMSIPVSICCGLKSIRCWTTSRSIRYGTGSARCPCG